jgi:hypothetical protein
MNRELFFLTRFVEISQHYHGPEIDSIRLPTLGGLTPWSERFHPI